jgi:hypothetical protein
MGSLSRNTLKHIKSVVSAIFTLAKQQDYFHAENPPVTLRSILALLSRKKLMPTRLKKSTPFSCGYPACGYSVCNSDLHGVTARRDSRTAMGELSKRRNASLSFNLEWAA